MIDFLSAETDGEIASTFAVMHQLRPHLERDGYVARMRELRASDGLRLRSRSNGVPSKLGTCLRE